MQPPVIIIEYAELTQSDLRRDASVQVGLIPRLDTIDHRMNECLFSFR